MTANIIDAADRFNERRKLIEFSRWRAERKAERLDAARQVMKTDEWKRLLSVSADYDCQMFVAPELDGA